MGREHWKAGDWSRSSQEEGGHHRAGRATRSYPDPRIRGRRSPARPAPRTAVPRSSPPLRSSLYFFDRVGSENAGSRRAFK